MSKQTNKTIYISLIEEMKYEIQDVIEFVCYLLAQKSNDYTVLDLLCNYPQRPANDNEPLIELTSAVDKSYSGTSF